MPFFMTYPVAQTHTPPLKTSFFDMSQILQTVPLEHVKHPGIN